MLNVGASADLRSGEALPCSRGLMEHEMTAKKASWRPTGRCDLIILTGLPLLLKCRVAFFRMRANFADMLVDNALHLLELIVI